MADMRRIRQPGTALVACCFLVEIVMTMVFLFIIMGGTMARRPQALPRAK
jgi:glycerol uptake facilitator-like aquaporin